MKESRGILSNRVIFKVREQVALKKRPPYKKLLFISVFLMVSLGVFYFLLCSSFFRVADIRINGLVTLDEQFVLEEMRIFLNETKFIALKQNNWFLFSSFGLQQYLQEKFPKIGSLSISKKFPDGLVINFQEREMVGIWCAINIKTMEDSPVSRNCFYVDKNGVIFDEAPQIKGSLILVINDFSPQDTIEIGRAVIKESLLGKFILGKEFLEEELSLGIGAFEILEFEPEEFRVQVMAGPVEGWIIYFSEIHDFNSQLLALKEILNKIPEREMRAFEYVDLRVEGRAYYK